MKKLLFIAMVAFGLIVNAQDGEFNVGANLGLPVGDFDEAYGLSLNLEANYLFSISDDFKVGPSISYLAYFPKSDYSDILDTVSYLPIAAAGRFNASEEFTIGLDLGYGIGLSPDGIESGFHYRPLVGYSVSENIMIQASYSGISVDGGSANNIALGAVIGL